MRIGPAVRARVYYRENGVWTLSENAITLPEGWYVVPSSFVEEQ